MKKLHFIILLSAVVLLCNACEKVIEFDIPEAEPLIVVNSFVTNGDPIIMDVSSSLSYLESTEQIPVISDAEINLNSGGSNYTFTELNNKPGTYVSEEPYNGADGLSLNVSAEGFTSVTSETIVPAPIDAELTILSIEDVEYELRLSFSDALNTEDYYQLLVVETYQGDPESYPSTFTSSDEILLTSGEVFGEEENYYYADALFTDFLFENGEASIEFNVDLYNAEFSQYEIHLVRASRDYFEYHRSYLLAQNTDPLFGQPVQIYSNIDGGIGVFGGYAVTKIPLEI